MSFELVLPNNFQTSEILAFHGRDREGLAERVGENKIEKGLLIEGKPTRLRVQLTPGKALCRIDADGALSKNARLSAEVSAKKMLGLLIDPKPFERAVRKDRLLGPLVKKQTGLRIPQVATVFEALTWAVIGQQIHLSFAIALRRTFIRLSGKKHSSGLYCYPDAEAVSHLDADELGRNKFSRAKAETLIRIATLVKNKELDLESRTFDVKDSRHRPEMISERLLAIKGVGPWTVNYVLLRGYGFADASLHGDSAVRAALQKRSPGKKKYPAPETERILKKYAPYRSLAAAHLWSSLKANA